MCPPGVDQTTRSAQSWFMMVPSVREKHGINFMARNNNWADTVQIDCWAWEKLARPDPDTLNGISSVLHLHPRPQPSSALIGLPPEIFSEILTYLDKTTIISLASSCLVCTYRLIPHINHGILTRSAPWADQPLACLGTYLTTLPPAFERDALALRSVGLERLLEPVNDPPLINGWYRDQMCTARKYNWAAISQYNGPQSMYRWNIGYKNEEELTCASEGLGWLSALATVERMEPRSTESPAITICVLKQALRALLYYGTIKPGQFSNAKGRSKLSSPIGKVTNRLRKRNLSSLDDETSTDASRETLEPSNIWYLRNLDTKEFVRLALCEVTAKAAEKKQAKRRRSSGATVSGKPASEPVFRLCTPAGSEQHTWLAAAVVHEGLETIPVEVVIALRSFWADASSTRHQRGPVERLRSKDATWAGHRFDIISEDMHHKTACSELAQAQQPVDELDVATIESSTVENSIAQNIEWRDATEESVQIVWQCFK